MKQERDVFTEILIFLEECGWTPKHDDEQSYQELVRAGESYIDVAREEAEGFEFPDRPFYWPWSDACWMPEGYRRNLIKGIALLVREVMRFDRNEGKTGKVNARQTRRGAGVDEIRKEHVETKECNPQQPEESHETTYCQCQMGAVLEALKAEEAGHLETYDQAMKLDEKLTATEKRLAEAVELIRDAEGRIACDTESRAMAILAKSGRPHGPKWDNFEAWEAADPIPWHDGRFSAKDVTKIAKEAFEAARDLDDS